MPIVKLTEATNVARHKCPICKSEVDIDIADLEAGVGMTGIFNKDAVKMPACATCGATETWRVTWGTIPSNVTVATQNFLRQHLAKVVHQQNAACKAAQDAETTVPLVILPGWPS